MRSSEMPFLKYWEIGDLLFLLSHYWKFGILGEKLHVKKKSHCPIRIFAKTFLSLHLFRVGDCFCGLRKGKYSLSLSVSLAQCLAERSTQ